MTDYDTYRADLVAWEKERERQRVEFKITENDPHADMRAGEDTEVGTNCYSISKVFPANLSKLICHDIQ